LDDLELMANWLDGILASADAEPKKAGNGELSISLPESRHSKFEARRQLLAGSSLSRR